MRTLSNHKKHSTDSKGKVRTHIRRTKTAKSKHWQPPRTAAQLFSMPRRFQDHWNRAVQVPSEMRSQGLTLRQASRQLGVSPKVVLRLVGKTFTKKRGRYHVKPTDHLLRILLIPSRKGLREIAVRDSREASLIGEYWSAVEKYLTRGDASALKKLRRKSVIDAAGRRVRLLTNLEELSRQGSAGVLRFESIYGRAA
jgi:hypothetical protein